MNLFDGIRLAFQQIRAQKLKSFFAVLGVFIGAMFLVTVVSVITGLNNYMEEDFARRIYGLNTVSVRRMPSMQMNPSREERRAWLRRPRLTFADYEAVRDELEVPATVGIESHTGGTLEADDGTTVENVWLTAAAAEYFTIRQMELANGRAFTSAEARLGQPVVVLGWEAADKLFGARDPVGRTIKVRGQPFQVVGVIEKQGTLFGMSMDNRAVAPALSPMARMVNPHRVIDEITVKAADAHSVARAQTEVEAILRRRHRLEPTEPNDFALETAEDSLSFWNRISQVLMIAFPGLVAIALVVGGMVIMNIMLVSVAERTREIGVRKALGAKRKDIVFQVLVESATLSGLGALMGIVVGQGLAQVVRAVSPLPTAIAPFWMTMAALMGVGVGVLAGIYPASRAARLDPVVALRSE